MMPLLNLNLMYIKVVKFKTLYFILKIYFLFIYKVSIQLKNNNFYFRTCIKMYRKCIA